MTACAEKLALSLMLALADLDADMRASVERMRGRALEEAAARTGDWRELDGGLRLMRALELGLGAVCADPVMSAPPCAVDGRVSDVNIWYLLKDRALFNCAALALMAAQGGRVMLRLESELGLPGEWWDEAALCAEAPAHLGSVQPIVLISADPGRGTREYRSLASGMRMTDSVDERDSAPDGDGNSASASCAQFVRIQSPARGDAIDAPLPGAEELARATAAQPDGRGRAGREVWLLLAAMLLCGGAIYGLYSMVMRLLA